ncbi:hypothetical protein CGRA01v4_14647 [Colletotrichum graminicola]|nr:hypothetical protein CGRA01v4_14647 [Colletotrichum graminicola]
MCATTYATAVADVAGKCLGLPLIGLVGCVSWVIFKNRRSTGHHCPLLASLFLISVSALPCSAI